MATSRGARLALLGHTATLHATPALGESPTMPKAWIYWLLFEPMSEADVHALVKSLRARVPVFSVFGGAQFDVVLTVPLGGIERASTTPGGRAIFRGDAITFGDADSTPSPMLTGGFGFQNVTPELLAELANCPEATDARLLAALELWRAASQERLARTKFLTYMTILDSLAAQANRVESVIKWVDEKITEAKAFRDPALVSALGSLKRESHGTALKNLVSRAATQLNLSPADTDAKVGLVAPLYRTRSNLSHQGGGAACDPVAARALAAFVLRAAIASPAILDVG